MSNTRKKYHGRKNKTHKKSKVTKATIEQIKQNRRRNKMIRNIRMGRIHRGGYGYSTVSQTGGGGGGSGGGSTSGFVSQFIGKPWTSDSLGSNYFALSPKGVGTGVVPTFDDGQPVTSARYPTQLGPQVAKLGQTGGGSRKKSKKNRKHSRGVRGGGIVSDLGNMVDNVKYSWSNLNAKLAGENPPPSPNPYNQPISKNIVNI